MKTQHVSLVVATAALIALSACNTEDVAISPYAESSANYASATIPSQTTSHSEFDDAGVALLLDFTFYLDVEKLPCRQVQVTTGDVEQGMANGRTEGGSTKCIETLRVNGEGQGYDDALGRAIGQLSFDYGRDIQTICGTLTLDFLVGSDQVQLEFCGKASADDPAGLTIENVSLAKGTGAFENAQFNGDLIIANASEMNNAVDGSVLLQIIVDGEMINGTL